MVIFSAVGSHKGAKWLSINREERFLTTELRARMSSRRTTRLCELRQSVTHIKIVAKKTV